MFENFWHNIMSLFECAEKSSSDFRSFNTIACEAEKVFNSKLNHYQEIEARATQHWNKRIK